MPKIANGGFNNPFLQEEIQIWKNSAVAARIEEYSPNHNFLINAYFGKLFLGYLTGGAMNKTHILVFQYSTWFDHKIHLNIYVVILQHRNRISYSDPATTRNEPPTTGTNLQQ